MRKETDDVTIHILQTLRNMNHFELAISSLATACINLYREASIIAQLEENYAYAYIQSTPQFLSYMATMELNLHLLADFYNCDYEQKKQDIIVNLKKEYHIS